MFIKVHRYSRVQEYNGTIMLLNTDNIITAIDRGNYVELRDVTETIYTISETLSEFYDMVHPDDPQMKVCKENKSAGSIDHTTCYVC